MEIAAIALLLCALGVTAFAPYFSPSDPTTLHPSPLAHTELADARFDDSYALETDTPGASADRRGAPTVRRS